MYRRLTHSQFFCRYPLSSPIPIPVRHRFPTSSLPAFLMQDTDDPLVPDVAHLYKTNKAQYEQNARNFTLKNAV